MSTGFASRGSNPWAGSPREGQGSKSTIGSLLYTSKEGKGQRRRHQGHNVPRSSPDLGGSTRRLHRRIQNLDTKGKTPTIRQRDPAEHTEGSRRRPGRHHQE